MTNPIAVIIGAFVAIVLGTVLIAVGNSVEHIGMVGLGVLMIVIPPAIIVIGVITNQWD